VLAVSVSGFYDSLPRQARPDPEVALRADLRAAHAERRGTYGRPRLAQALRACAHMVGHKRVARLMREEGLRGKVKGRGFMPRTTDSRHDRPVAENRLDRQFAVGHSHPAWVGDITYIATQEGWLYLAAVIDLRTRQVLGYGLSERMSHDLVRQAFLNAWSASPVSAGVVFHSDRGSQYASKYFSMTLAAHGFVPSMSRKGNCWDNAVAESFFATLKNEEARSVYKTKPAAHAALASYIHGFYNPTRLHSALGYLSPNHYAKKLKQAA
jgi:transposase InsO family protein